MRNDLRILLLCICCLSASSVIAGGRPAHLPKADELLFFDERGPLSPFKFVQVTILQDGSGIVEAEGTGFNNETKKPYPRKLKYPFHLSADEVTALKIEIDEARFFSQPKKDTQMATDTGESVLWISVDGRKREISFKFRPEMYPITSFLRKLVSQAEALDDLENHGEAYEASCALDPNISPVLQPQVFREPMKKFAHTSNSSRQLREAMPALVGVMTDEEWLGFWASELNEASTSRRLLLLSLLTNGDLRVQRPVLAPVVFRWLDKDYRNWPNMSTDERQVYFFAISYLGNQHYTPATPVLVDMIRRGYEVRKLNGEVLPFNILPGVLMSSTANMGEPGIDAVEGLLGDSKAGVREYAVNTLSFMMSTDPESLYKYYGPHQDAKYLLKRLRTFVPKLQEMAQNDPDRTVRDAAKSAVERIQAGWPKPLDTK